MDAADSPIHPASVVQLAKRINGLAQTQLIYVAAKLAIADKVANGGMSIADLARETSTVESRLYRVMRALVTLGLFSESSNGFFELTQAGRPLLTGMSDSLRDLAIMMGSEWSVRSWGNIMYALQTESSAFEGEFGIDLFSYFAQNEKAASEFDNAMTLASTKQANSICAAYDFSRAAKITDVGGGHGHLLSEVLTRNPDLLGVLIERPTLIEAAYDYLNNAGLVSRCEVLAGDFFKNVPSGSDIYILKYIIHNWDDLKATEILKNCRKAISRNGKVLIVDSVLPEKLGFSDVSHDMQMMVLLGQGRERTLTEFENLLSLAGLSLNNVIPTGSDLTILEAVPAHE